MSTLTTKRLPIRHAVTGQIIGHATIEVGLADPNDPAMALLDQMLYGPDEARCIYQCGRTVERRSSMCPPCGQAATTRILADERRSGADRRTA